MDPEFGLIVYRGGFYGNVGDDIQSLAAIPFLPRIHHNIPIDEIGHWSRPSCTKGGRVRLILNGWFTSNPDSWPPSSDIDPLFVSFHATDIVDPGSSHSGPNSLRPPIDVMLREELLSYYKQYEPIGCRDITTRDQFTLRGIRAYFSGCLTLTFRRWKLPRKDHICIVDPECDEERLLTSVPVPLRSRVIRLSHVFDARGMDVDNRFKHARKVLECYQAAAVVVTSRIHCALPCLAFGTPVLFIPPATDPKRLPGLLELMNCLAPECVPDAAFWHEAPPNPTAWRSLAHDLQQRCASFCGSCPTSAF